MEKSWNCVFKFLWELCMCVQQSLRSACAYGQSDQSLCLSLEYSMTVKPLTEHHLGFLNLKGSCTGSSESTLVKMPHCWKSHVAALVKTDEYIVLYKFYPLYLLKKLNMPDTCGYHWTRTTLTLYETDNKLMLTDID